MATAAAARLTAARLLVDASLSSEQLRPSGPLGCLLPATPGEVTSTRVRRCAGESSATSMARRWASRRDRRSGMPGAASLQAEADEASDENGAVDDADAGDEDEDEDDEAVESSAPPPPPRAPRPPLAP